MVPIVLLVIAVGLTQILHRAKFGKVTFLLLRTLSYTFAHKN